MYLGRDIISKRNVVLKLEPVKGKDHTIEHEILVYKRLYGGTGIPLVHWFGSESGFDAMAMECLGPSLEDFFSRCSYCFNIKTVLLLAGQLVSNSAIEATMIC